MKHHRVILAALGAALYSAGGAHAQTPLANDGWDYSIINSTIEDYLSTNYGVINGAKAIVPFQNATYSGVKGADGARVADVDGDGDYDVVTVYEESKELYVYENTDPVSEHRNAFRRQLIGIGCGGSEEAIFFDFDGDDDPDIVCTATSGGPGLAGEIIYVYENNINGRTGCHLSAPSPCWSLTPSSLGANVPQKDWYRLGGDLGSMDINNDGCPDLAIGSAGGEVGVLWCPLNEDRADPLDWTYQRLWNVNDAEVQKLSMIRRSNGAWLVWSVKDPNQGVYYAKYKAGTGYGPTAKWSAITRLVKDVYSMEFTIADVDGDNAPDLVLPTREDPRANNRGAVRVYWGNNKLNRPWIDLNYSLFTLQWANTRCNGLRNENIAKGVSVGEVWAATGGPNVADIVVMGRGCPYAANGFLFYRSLLTDLASVRNPLNWAWRSLTNHKGSVMQDAEEQKWDAPQLVDLDGDGDQDIVGSDENGDWGDTFKNGVNDADGAPGSDPHDDGLGTVVFWNPTL